VKKYLIVGPSWVGDMVMAGSLFSLLASRGGIIDVLAPGWSLPMLKRMPDVRSGIEMPLAHGEFGLGRRRRVGRSLATSGYDCAIVLPRSFKSALVPWFARIPVRTGFRGEFRFGLLNDIRPFDENILDQTVKRFAALGLDRDEALPASLPAPVLTPDTRSLRSVMTRLRLGHDEPVVAMMPGAEYGPAKCWPLEYFATVATELTKSGAQVWIFGSEKDRAAGGAISSGNDAKNLCGKTSLEEVVDLLSVCRAAVTNDSGLMHVAAAVGSHVVALYGSTTPAFTPPLTEDASIVYLSLECSPCFERECPLQHFRCMRDIEPAEVLGCVQPLLASARA